MWKVQDPSRGLPVALLTTCTFTSIFTFLLTSMYHASPLNNMTNNNNNNTSYTDVTEWTFSVSFESVDGIRVRIRRGIFNLGHGLVLCQYRVMDDYQRVKISILHNDKHVAGSPYIVGPVLHENCACPLQSYAEWMENFQCPEADERIRLDLELFQEEGINITNLYERGAEMFPRISFIHYSIVDHKVCYYSSL